MAPKPVSNRNVYNLGKRHMKHSVDTVTLWVEGKGDTMFINHNLVNDYKSSKLLSPFFLKFHFQELLWNYGIMFIKRYFWRYCNNYGKQREA